MNSASRMFVISLILGSVLSWFQSSPWLSAHSDTVNEDVVLVGAGDIATCDSTKDSDTAALLDMIPGTIAMLGDGAYPDGTLQEYTDCYEPTWGRHKARTRPAVGNHEYHVKGAEGYFTYFGTAASPLDAPCTKDCKGYYSYDLGAWHIIVLNSEIDMSVGSTQEQWLRADLAAHGHVCTLTYWHRPRFTSNDIENEERVRPLWDALYEFGADVVLNGHKHNYERFALQNPNGEADPERGIRQFVVGTGGTTHSSFDTVQPNSEIREFLTWGVLKLTLHPTSYDWDFIPIAGQTFRDSGSDDCVTFGSSPTNTPTLTNTPTPTHTPTPTITSIPTATPTLTTIPTATTTPNPTITPNLTSTVTPDLTATEPVLTDATATSIATSATTVPQGNQQTATPQPDRLYLPRIIP